MSCVGGGGVSEYFFLKLIILVIVGDIPNSNPLCCMELVKKFVVVVGGWLCVNLF